MGFIKLSIFEAKILFFGDYNINNIVIIEASNCDCVIIIMVHASLLIFMQLQPPIYNMTHLHLYL